MPRTMTLHQGGSSADFVEHPTETARRALDAAADVERVSDPVLASQMRRFSMTLPKRRARLSGSAGRDERR